jgi:transposase
MDVSSDHEWLVLRVARGPAVADVAARRVPADEDSPALFLCVAWESGGIRGFDAGKKIKGRKRHIITDTNGFLVGGVIHSADVQDRDGAPLVLKSIRSAFPWLRHIFADGGYAGKKLRAALQGKGNWTFEIVKRSDTAKGFELIPRRWVVERTFAWLNRTRRLAKDFERTIASATTWLFMASVQQITRRLARLCNQTPSL